MKWSLGLLIASICLALFLRIYHLGATPISLNWDETALGYNAYSILKTGKDEYGTKFPLILRSFGNYTPALYTYLTIPAIAMFGLNSFAVRLPSAVMGMLAVIGTFLLVRKLISQEIASVATFLMAISPWHLQFSRVAYEANIALVLIIWGLYFFLRGLSRPPWYLLSAVLYGLSLNAYHSTRLFVPVFLCGLFIIFRPILLKQQRWVFFASLIGCIFLLPFVYLSFSGQSEQVTARFTATNIFRSEQQKIANSQQHQSIAESIFFSAIPSTLYQVAYGYASHFSLRWLFITGDNDRHHAPSTGLLYIWELPLLLIGLVYLLKKNDKKRSVLLLWLFTVPITASLTVEVPHAVRTLIWLPLPQILVAMGCTHAYQNLCRKSWLRRAFIFFLFFCIIGFSFGEYFELYHRQMNLESSRFWQFGYEHAVNFINQNKDTYDTIYVSHKLEQPYIFFLFYLKYNPATYLAVGGTKSYTRQSFDKFVFSDIDWETRKLPGKHLYVLDPYEAKITPIQRVIHTIRYFDGSEAIVFAE